jgi:hypothetical protein
LAAEFFAGNLSLRKLKQYKNLTEIPLRCQADLENDADRLARSPRAPCFAAGRLPPTPPAAIRHFKDLSEIRVVNPFASASRAHR